MCRYDVEGIAPYKRLWFAVLERAIKDLSNEKAAIRLSATSWLASGKHDGVGSCVYVCRVLEVDADKIRKKVFLKKGLDRAGEGYDAEKGLSVVF